MKQKLDDHTNHDIKLFNGWKYDRYPKIGNEKIGSPINSSSYVCIKKAKYRLTFRVNDGRIGGNVIILANLKKSNYGEVYIYEKNYDYAIQKFHSLMRML